MAVIEFTPSDPKKNKLANYFADQEVQDFREMCELFQTQNEASFLFKDVNFMDLYNDVMAKIQEKYADKNGELKPQYVKEINNHYAERFDLDDFYEDFLAEN